MSDGHGGAGPDRQIVLPLKTWANRMARVLTQIAIDAEKPSDKRREMADAKAPGLFFILQPSGVNAR